jgi:hypothetical protein
MKKSLFLLLIVFVYATTSCKKETVTNNNVLNTVSNKSITGNQSNQLVTMGTRFGASISNVLADDKIIVAQKLGVGYVRTAINLKNLNGKNMVDLYLKNGFKILLNLNYGQVTDQPIPFPKDMVAYRKLIENVLNKYKPEIAVIENEPTNKNFHSGPIEDYITMLGVAIDVCKARGIKVADGCIHIKYVQQIMQGLTLNENATEVKKLIAAYKTLDLDYVNVHTKGEDLPYPVDEIKSTANYLRSKTGKQVITNEFSIHSDSPELLKSMVQGWKDGGYVYAIVYSGNSGSQAMPLNNATTLTSLGKVYRDAIK